jgi:small subunit ribosomal protein S8
MSLKPKPVRTNIVVSDPIADLLTRIRNCNERYLHDVKLPSSRIKEAISRILVEEGYIESVDVKGEGQNQLLSLKLKYKGKRNRDRVIRGLERISKSSRRIYAGVDQIPHVMGGMGITILSTSQGLMTGNKARELNIGGEVICKVW